MIYKLQIIEEVLRAEVTPRMRQNLSLGFSAQITVFDMILKLLHIV